MHNGYMHVLPNPFFHMCVRVLVCVCVSSWSRDGIRDDSPGPLRVSTGEQTNRLAKGADARPDPSTTPTQARASSPAAWRGRVQLVSSFLLHSTAGRGMPSPRAWGRSRGSGAQSSCKQRATKSKSLKQFRRKSSKIVLHELRRQPETETAIATEAETEIEQQKQKTEKKQ